MKKFLLAVLVFGSFNVFAADTVLTCSNEVTDIVVGVEAATATSPDETLKIDLTVPEGTTTTYISAGYYLQDEALDAIALNPLNLVASHGVVAEGIYIRASGAEAVLVYNGYVQLLTCTWAP